MALQYDLFRGDAKLEAAATSDAAHIVQGSSGPHVAKIQKALNTLDSAGLDEDGTFGSGMARCVLRYKTARSIINASRQTTPDNIVGRMTIAAMDAELVAGRLPTTVVPEVIIGLLARAPAPTPFRYSSPPQSHPKAVASSIPVAVRLQAVVRGSPYVPKHAKDAGLPSSLPPSRSYQVPISVLPPLPHGQSISIEIIGSSSDNGTATVTPKEISGTSVVTVTGGKQTRPGFGGHLQIQATLNGSVVALSDGFTVCAHVQSMKRELWFDVDGQPHPEDTRRARFSASLGLVVKVTSTSDSGNFSDLDQFDNSEVINRGAFNSPPFSTGSGRNNVSGYQPTIPPPDPTTGAPQSAADIYTVPKPTTKIDKPGITEVFQVHMLHCKRCGAKDKSIPKSGWYILQEILKKNDKWIHRASATGAVTGCLIEETGKTILTTAGVGNPVSRDHDL